MFVKPFAQKTTTNFEILKDETIHKTWEINQIFS
jgi:hypothetical protein